MRTANQAAAAALDTIPTSRAADSPPSCSALRAYGRALPYESPSRRAAAARPGGDLWCGSCSCRAAASALRTTWPVLRRNWSCSASLLTCLQQRATSKVAAALPRCPQFLPQRLPPSPLRRRAQTQLRPARATARGLPVHLLPAAWRTSLERSERLHRNNPWRTSPRLPTGCTGCLFAARAAVPACSTQWRLCSLVGEGVVP